MRVKKYFQNMKHHKELDRAMGLSQRMNEPFAKLADACGMDSNLGGTTGLYPFPIISTRHGDIKQTKLYDVTSKEAKKSFPLDSPN